MVGLLIWSFVVAQEPLLVCVTTHKFGSTYAILKVAPLF